MQTQGTARLSGSSSASTPTTQLATLVIVNGRTTPCGCLRRTSRWAGAFCGTLARRHLSGRRLSFCLVGQITVAAWHLLRRRRPRHLPSHHHFRLTSEFGHHSRHAHHRHLRRHLHCRRRRTATRVTIVSRAHRVQSLTATALANASAAHGLATASAIALRSRSVLTSRATDAMAATVMGHQAVRYAARRRRRRRRLSRAHCQPI